MNNLQEQRMRNALEVANIVPIAYIDQYGKTHNSKSTRDAVDICRVFRKYSFTNFAIETSRNAVTGVYCDQHGLKKFIEAFGLDVKRQVILKIKTKYIIIFKHPMYDIDENVKLSKNCILLKDGSLIPGYGCKLIGEHNSYYDVELVNGSIRDIEDFPDELEGFINV